MRMHWFATAAMVLAGAAGCAVTADDQGGATDEEIRSTAWQGLVGVWTDNDTSGDYHVVVFESAADHSGHHFFAESQGALISCHPGTGCTHSRTRTEGYFTATAAHVTLHVAGQSNEVFSYTQDGDALTLGRYGVDAGFARTVSYCDTVDDCNSEGIIHPFCAPGGFTCGTDNTCSFTCGSSRGVGATCGGIAGLQCDAGLDCVIPSGPSHPDQSGTCQVHDAGRGVGATCGGIANLQCDTGLDCVYPSGPSHPDQSGTCQHGRTGRGVGETCGGFAGLQCATDLACVLPPGPGFPDEAGTCRPVAQEGEHCGGNLANAPVCADGLRCQLDTGNPDVGGTCQHWR